MFSFWLKEKVKLGNLFRQHAKKHSELETVNK